MSSHPVRKLAGWVLVVVVGSAAVAGAQKNPYRNYTEEKFVQNMQTAGRNYAAVAAFVAKSDYESAKAQLTRAREQLAITITFWRNSKKDDAVAMLRNALNGMDDLDVALGAQNVDPSALRTVSERINTACEACHVAYRDRDPATKAYRVKPGSVR
jgi:cytochrome c556